MYKLVIFDFDGTILDTDYLVVDAYLKLFQKYRPSYKPSFKELAALSGPTLEESLEKYFKGYDINMLIEEFKSISNTMYYTHASMYEGIVPRLQELKAHGIKIALNTNKRRSATKHCFKLYGIEDLFDMSITSSDVKKPKPNGEGILKCIDCLEMNKDDTLFIGDSLIDLKACNDAKVDCLLVTWSLHGEIKESHPKYTCHNMDEMMEVIYGK